MRSNHVKERDAFCLELKALADKYQMGLVCFFERKDYATKKDIDTECGMLVHQASRGDMAHYINNLIEEYPELAHILLMEKLKEDQSQKPHPLEEVISMIDSLLGALGKPQKSTGKDEPEVEAAKEKSGANTDKKPDAKIRGGVVHMDSDDLPPEVKTFFENILKKAG